MTPRTDEKVANLCDEAADGDWKTCFKEMHQHAMQLENELMAVHDAVLEAAAVEVEVRGMIYGADAAKAIRALKRS